MIHWLDVWLLNDKTQTCASFGVFSAHSQTLALYFQGLQDLQIKTWQASLLHWLSQKPGSTPNWCNIHIPWGPNWEAVVGGNKYKICYRWLTQGAQVVNTGAHQGRIYWIIYQQYIMIQNCHNLSTFQSHSLRRNQRDFPTSTYDQSGKCRDTTLLAGHNMVGGGTKYWF